jgi:hypothetical protein
MNREQRNAWLDHVFSTNDLTNGERLVLLMLERFADFSDGTNARPGTDTLAVKLGCGRRVVELALHKGRQLNLIEQTSRANPKRRRAAVYRIVPLPIQPAQPCGQKPDLNPHEGPGRNGFNPHECSFSTRTYVRPTLREDPKVPVTTSTRRSEIATDVTEYGNVDYNSPEQPSNVVTIRPRTRKKSIE